MDDAFLLHFHAAAATSISGAEFRWFPTCVETEDCVMVPMDIDMFAEENYCVDIDTAITVICMIILRSR